MPVYGGLTTFEEQKVRDLFEEHLLDDYKYFYSARYVSLYAKKMFSLLVPVFATDAAHYFGSIKGTLFSFYGMDKDHRQVCIGFMVVAVNESEKTWSLFLRFIKSSLEVQWNNVVVIIGQDRGGNAALHTVMPESERCFCTWHRNQNVAKKH